MSVDAEALGIRARIDLTNQEIAQHADDLKAATAAHWEHHYEHELFDALRRRDVLAARLADIEKTRKTP